MPTAKFDFSHHPSRYSKPPFKVLASLKAQDLSPSVIVQERYPLLYHSQMLYTAAMRLSHNLLAIAMYRLLWLYGKLPLRLLNVIGAGYGWLQLHLRSKSCRIAWINIEHCFGSANNQANKGLLAQFMLQRGRELSLNAAILTRPNSALKRMVCRVHGGTALSQALQDGPVVLLNAHMGSLILGASQSDFSALWFSQQQKGLFEPILERRRTTLAAKGYVYTNVAGVRLAHRVLNNQGAVVIFCDHDPGTKAGRVLVDFFGKPAYTSTLPIKLIQSNKARAFFYICIRHNNQPLYHLHIFPAHQSLYDNDCALATQAMNDQLASIVSQHAPHFDWTYERFRRAHKNLYKPASKQSKRRAPASN